jgi:Phage tail assembly chaperone proteins, E, or 41 or 14
MNVPARKVAREGFQTDQAPLPDPSPSSADVWPVVVKLQHRALRDPSRPDEIRELHLRQPTGGDINAVGCPVIMGEGGRFVVEDKRMHLMIGRLAGILTPILDGIDPRDWQTAAYRLFRFFIPNPAAWED